MTTLPTLSVLDLVPVRSDQSSGDAVRATLSLARAADDLGYERFWMAEHHNMPAVASTNPPVLIAMVAGATSRIRVGSGGVMLPNHAPLVVAEQFALLEAAHPGRIDLGIGRAPGADGVTSWALRHGAGGVSEDNVTHFPEYVDNVIAMMDADGVGVRVQGRTHVLNAEEAYRLALPQLLTMLALRSGHPLAAQVLVEEAEKRELGAGEQSMVDAMARRWVIGDPAGAREELLALATTYGVDEVMVNPVAGAHVGTEPGSAPAREETLRLLAS